MKLTEDEQTQLREILKWWNEKSIENDPRFSHDNPRIGPVRLSSMMYEDALKLARSKGNWRTFSRMVEILIWQALGSDPKYLKTDVTDEKDQP